MDDVDDVNDVNDVDDVNDVNDVDDVLSNQDVLSQRVFRYGLFGKNQFGNLS